jgi:hypothetical protein
MKTFKLGVDWHGVIDALPDVLSFLTKAVIAQGGEVHILTGMSWTKECEDKLKEMDIPFTHHFSIFDYHKEIGTEIIGYHEKYNIPKIDDVIWDKTKGDYCKEHEITLHIDDTTAYNDYFTTPFARLWTHNNKPKGTHKDERHLK